jgi:hypothetical protein
MPIALEYRIMIGTIGSREGYQRKQGVRHGQGKLTGYINDPQEGQTRKFLRLGMVLVTTTLVKP